MRDAQTSDIEEHVSIYTFAATLERLVAAIGGAGMTIFSTIDHQAGAREAGLDMPQTTVLIYGNPRGGTPIMLAAPLAALDLPLRVLVRVRDDGQCSIAFHPVEQTLLRAGVANALAAKLQGAQEIIKKAVLF